MKKIINLYLDIEKKFFKSWHLKRIDRMYKLYNITTNHFCLDSQGEKCNLWSEFQVIGKNLDEALYNARYQLNKINLNLSSNFDIDNIWLLKKELVLKKNNSKIKISSLPESDIKLCLFNRNLIYLKEEFDYVKKQAQINNSSAYIQ